MDALQLLTWSLILYLFASLASLFLLGLDRLAIKLSGITSLVGGVIGIISGITQLHEGVTLVARFATPFDFADLTLRMDSLSAFMVLVISLLVVVCSLYSLTYMREYEGKGAAAMGFFMNIFIASMVALLVMDNAFWFIVLFEMMSLSSWFLVIARQDKTSINAGMLYFFIAHAGSVLIMIAFLLMGRESGSLDFASFRTLSLSPGLASAVFLLAFFGFGAKAGMMPLHSWLPRAHPAAPSHASALMSGVMVKIGIFGILKVAMDLLAQTGFAAVVGHSGDGDRRNLRAPGRAVCAGGTGYQTAAGLEYRRKRRHYFAGSRCGDGRSVTTRPAAHRGWTARRTVSSAQPCAVQRAAISRRGRDYFAFAYPRHGKNGGTGETDAVDSRSMPDWLPRDISPSSAEWFYQRMVHLAVAVLTKSCGSRSATTCGSYCYGDAGSHWWAGSNVLRQNVRYYFLWCAAQYTR
ncbi:NADH dehydrogenase subunit N [Escherichia coli TW10246]|nr:NADH dehydrogenase subunit N [Escherichia coli TW10246]